MAAAVRVMFWMSSLTAVSNVSWLVLALTTCPALASSNPAMTWSMVVKLAVAILPATKSAALTFPKVWVRLRRSYWRLSLSIMAEFSFSFCCFVFLFDGNFFLRPLDDSSQVRIHRFGQSQSCLQRWNPHTFFYV